MMGNRAAVQCKVVAKKKMSDAHRCQMLISVLGVDFKTRLRDPA